MIIQCEGHMKSMGFHNQEGVDRGGGGTGVEGAESGVEGAGSGGRGGGKRE